MEWILLISLKESFELQVWSQNCVTRLVKVILLFHEIIRFLPDLFIILHFFGKIFKTENLMRCHGCLSNWQKDTNTLPNMDKYCSSCPNHSAFCLKHEITLWKCSIWNRPLDVMKNSAYLTDVRFRVICIRWRNRRPLNAYIRVYDKKGNTVRTKRRMTAIFSHKGLRTYNSGLRLVGIIRGHVSYEITGYNKEHHL